MTVTAITGKLGAGKSLVAVGRIRERLRNGRAVATNLDLDLPLLLGRFNKTARVIRVPDKPSLFDLEVVGVGNESPDEEFNGLLTLDELGTWFNSRNWNDKARLPVINWLLHSRKLGWDLDLIVQDVSLIDSQAREGVVENTAFCRRLDRMNVPFVGTIFSMLTGKRLTLPKLHFAKVVYGYSKSDLVIDRWHYRATDLYGAYDTRQVFSNRYDCGVYSVLPPWYTHGRYMVPRDWGFLMRMTRIYWKRLKNPLIVSGGAFVGIVFAAVFGFQYAYSDLKSKYDAVSDAVIADQWLTESSNPDSPDLEDGYVSKLKELLNSLVITGSMNGRLQLADINDPYKNRFTDDDLAKMGFVLRRYSDCRLDVSIMGEVIPIFCAQVF